jgi:hypothetical protein
MKYKIAARTIGRSDDRIHQILFIGRKASKLWSFNESALPRAE